MTRTVRIAAVQMDVRPAPTAERLARAHELVRNAARSSAQLVVLPELFNTGYAYTAANFQLAESLEEVSVSWMRQTAAELNIHLAGSILLRENGDIYNALLLFSPRGQMWRYDKRYPWAWERGYFRERKNSMTVAQTDVGDWGMLICWDIGHPALWRQYAGRVDGMLVVSCPPEGTNPTYHFPDGRQITFDDLGPMMAALKGSGNRVFGDMLNQQTAWLGVPCVNSGAAGYCHTPLPRGRASLLSLLPLAPANARYLWSADRVQMSCVMIAACKIVDAEGKVVAQRAPDTGEGFAIADVNLAPTRPVPLGAQPVTSLGWWAYFSADVLIPWLMRPVYAHGIASLARHSQ